MKKVLGLLTALLIVSSPASANKPLTCGFLYDGWIEYKKTDDADKEVWLMMYYMGYLTAWVDTNVYFKLPKATKNQHIYHVVGKWLENHPEMWHEHQRLCVLRALEKAYGYKD